MSVDFANFELSENDLNGLFNFNIDLLKSAISALLKNQKSQNQRIFDLEYKIENNTTNNAITTNTTNVLASDNRINKNKEFDDYRKSNTSMTLDVMLF